MIRTLTNLAQVAKLVDALASGASGGNSVEVQVLSWAPVNTLNKELEDCCASIYLNEK